MHCMYEGGKTHRLGEATSHTGLEVAVMLSVELRGG